MADDWNDPDAGDARKAADEGWARASRANGATPPRFSFTNFDDLKPGPEQLYLAKRLIPRVGLTVVWGPPKCGKSFLTFDLMMHVALGWEYRGRKVLQGTVVYCAFEGAEGFKLRAEAFRRQHEPPAGVPFRLISDALDLVADHSALIAAIGAQLSGEVPAAVVLDTLNRSLRGSESSDEDMAAYIRAADAIRAAFGCVVVVVHHCGHDDKRPRGHSSLLGAVDAQIAVTRDAGDNIVATVERMKDGPEGETIVSRLEQVEVGTDEDGEPMTSCVVVPAEGDAKAATKRVSLPKSARVALLAMDEALTDAGARAPASNHIPPGVRVIGVDLWRQYAYKRGISAGDTTDRARQQSFKRACQSLLASGHVAIWDEQAWRTG